MHSNNDGMDPNWVPLSATLSNDDLHSTAMRLKMERDAFALDLKLECAASRELKKERDKLREAAERLAEVLDREFHLESCDRYDNTSICDACKALAAFRMDYPR